MKRKRSILVAAIGLVVVNVLVYAKLDITKIMQHSPTNHVGLLFVQRDNQALLQRSSGGKSYSLMLQHVPADVIYFSNEPKRLAGRVSIDNFLRVWKTHRIVPNVAISARQKKDSQLFNDVFAFSHPVYDAQHHCLHYTIQSITHEALPAALNLTDVSLFIDQYKQWPP